MNRATTFLLLLLPFLTFASARAEVVQAFDAHAPFAPIVADAGAAAQLVYELHLTNFAARPIVIDRVAVEDKDTGEVIGAAEGDGLGAWMGGLGPHDAANARQIAPGRRGFVYFNLPLERASPEAINHRIEFHFADDNDSTLRRLAGPTLEVDRRPSLTLGPPLRGGPWAAVYGPEMERGHRRVFYATEGSARIPGRFAIDWIRLDEHGRSAPAGATRLDQFQGYGADVLAVADARVAAVRDDMEEAKTLATLPRVSIGDASGNYVALDLGGGRYAFYEHLQPGVPVRKGERVRRGQVIGRLGLTGQGSEPHLHFHVADAASPLGAEGLPFLLDHFEILGVYSSIEAFGRGGPWIPSVRGETAASSSTPGPNMVVRFPN